MIRKEFITGLIVLSLAPAVLGQQQKIGYINSDEILSRMPEYEGIDQQLRVVAQEWRNEMQDMAEEIEQLEEEFDSREILYTDEEREEKRQEINRKKQELEEYRNQKFGPEGDYYIEQQELLEPIQRKIFDAIERIADEEGFDFVFDRASNTSMLFSDPQWNLNEEVLLELGIEPDE